MSDISKQLHEALAQKLLGLIEDGEVSAAVLKEAREFLKDNGMTDAARAKSPTQDLKDALGVAEPSFPFKFQS